MNMPPTLLLSRKSAWFYWGFLSALPVVLFVHAFRKSGTGTSA